jgi:hypothetical protein
MLISEAHHAQEYKSVNYVMLNTLRSLFNTVIKKKHILTHHTIENQMPGRLHCVLPLLTLSVLYITHVDTEFTLCVSLLILSLPCVTPVDTEVTLWYTYGNCVHLVYYPC